MQKDHALTRCFWCQVAVVFFFRRVGKGGVLFEPHVARVLDQGFDHRHHDHPTFVSRFVFDATRRSSACPTSMGVRILQQRTGRMWPPQPDECMRLWTASVRCDFGIVVRSFRCPSVRTFESTRPRQHVRSRPLVARPPCLPVGPSRWTCHVRPSLRGWVEGNGRVS